MNKKGRTGTIIVVILVIVAIIFFLMYYGQIGGKTVKEHAEPVDIASEQEGQGIKLRFFRFDDKGNKEYVEIPDWFKIAQTTGIVGAIVEHPPAPTCTVVADCPTTGADVECWQGSCVLTNLDGFTPSIEVTNTAAFEFTDVYISSASPTAFSDALPTGTVNKKDLPAGNTISWVSGDVIFEDAGWIGTSQTLSVTVSGTNSYDGTGHTSSDSITLKFSEDPTGTFSVIIQTSVPI